MPDNDIYDNKMKYERFYQNLPELVKKPSARSTLQRGVNRYYCRNPSNRGYFEHIKAYFEEKDFSYIRRMSLLYALKRVTHFAEKDLSELDQEGVRWR